MKPVTQIALIVTAALIAGAPVLADLQDGRKLSAGLTGAAEVPGPGDADGHGMIEVRLNPGQGQFCYTLSAHMIAAATAAHIHKGAAGTAGPVVIALNAPTTGQSTGCATITKELAQAILADPAGYYANVHNAEFPGGAVRGQLAK